jgi:hypothetical protein
MQRVMGRRNRTKKSIPSWTRTEKDPFWEMTDLVS